MIITGNGILVWYFTIEKPLVIIFYILFPIDFITFEYQLVKIRQSVNQGSFILGGKDIICKLKRRKFSVLL